MTLRVFAFIFVLMAVAQPARAEWHEASSDHFLVVAEQNEKDVREFTERLERFHSAALFVLGREDTTPSPSNRVTIYVVRSANQVQKLAGDKTGFLRGFYQARAGGSLAFTARVESDGRDVTQTEQILLHEYTHHIMHGVSEWATPRWLSEGFAEFFSTARFEKDGGVGIGLPALHRANELHLAKNVPIEALLDAATYAKLKTKTYDEFYGRSWLLYHYLSLSGKRAGQLGNYRAALANGQSELEAANSAFGDLKILDKELAAYLKQPKMSYLPIPAGKLKTGPIAVRKMSEAEAAIMPVVLESKRGVDDAMAKALLPRAQTIAAKYPDDPAVLSALSEAEHDAGNFTAALAAADKAIIASPALVNAHVQKIYALSRMADGADDTDVAWRTVRKAVTALNKVERDHPIPLIYYYQSLQASGKEVTEVAARGLERALELAPYDKNVRWQLVQLLISEKKNALAYRTLMPLANDPHNRSEDNPAIALLAEIRQKLEATVAEKQTEDQTTAAEEKPAD
jgi:tetratricopeptide (TPR) repeat protein